MRLSSLARASILTLVALRVSPALAQEGPADGASQVASAPVVVMPKLLTPLTPRYPAHATGNARVILHVTLDKSGAVTAVAVKNGAEPFASAAMRAAKRGVFSPAQRDGVALPVKITIAVDFTYAAEMEIAERPAAPPPKAEQSAASAKAARAADAPEAPEIIDIVVEVARTDETERVINKAEARLMAGTFGDPLRAIELLPGITPLIGGVPYFFVRGAPAGSVNFYIDDARIPQLYHVGPGSSVLHPRFAEGVALRSGPYRARFGDATSGVITARITTDIPEPTAEVEAKAFESGAYIGAPLGDNDGAVAIGGKASHMGYLLEQVNPELRLSYWDYQAAAAYYVTNRDQLTALIFGSNDYVGQEDDFGIVQTTVDSQFHRMKLGYNRNIAPGIDLRNYLIAGLDSSRFGDVNEEMSDRTFGGGTTIDYVVSDTLSWAAGITANATDFDASKALEWAGATHNAGVSRWDTQSALWTEGRISPGRRAHLDAGLRLAAYTSGDAKTAALEPRLTSTLDLTRRFKSILAIGYATQAPSALVPTPAIRPAELRGGLQEALQRSATFRYRVPTLFSAEVTAFYNDYRSLSDPLALSTVADTLEIGTGSGERDLEQEDPNYTERPSGRSVGLEFLLRRPITRALSGSLAYTLSRSTRVVQGRRVLSSFDRPHTVNTTLGYAFGDGYNVATRVMLYSGLPIRILGDISRRNGGRSDPFLRIDARFSKEWKLSWSNLMLIVEMMNATFAKEILGTSCSPQGCVTATFGPVSVPSIGLRGTFGGRDADEQKSRASSF